MTAIRGGWWMRPLLAMAVLGLTAGVTGVILEAQAAPEAHHRLSQSAVEIARPFGFPITNSMVVTWIVAAGSDRLCQSGHREHEAGPDGRAEFR